MESVLQTDIETKQQLSIREEELAVQKSLGDDRRNEKVLEAEIMGDPELPDHLKAIPYLQQNLDLIKMLYRQGDASDLNSSKNLGLYNNNIKSEDLVAIALYLGESSLAISKISVDKNDIIDLSFLHFFPNIKDLSCNRNHISDISEIQNCPKLESVSFDDNSIVTGNIKLVLNSLKSFSMSKNAFSGIINMSNCKQLESVTLSHNGTIDLVLNAKILKYLSLAAAKVRSGAFIEQCSNLRSLHLDGLQTDITELDLQHFTQLEELEILDTNIKIINYEGLKNITRFATKDIDFLSKRADLPLRYTDYNETTFWEKKEPTALDRESYFNQNKKRLHTVENAKQLIDMAKHSFTKISFKNSRNPSDLALLFSCHHSPSDLKVIYTEMLSTIDANTAIRVLEESRKAFDRNPETNASVQYILPREELLSLLSPQQIANLLLQGGQELLAGYESTFAIILNSYLEKDPSLSIIDSKGIKDQWQFLGLMSQMAPRYIHLNPKKYTQSIVTIIDHFSSPSKIDALIHGEEGFNITTVIDIILPMIQMLQIEGKGILYNQLYRFFVQLSKKIANYYQPHLKEQLSAQEEKEGWFDTFLQWIHIKKKEKKASTGALLIGNDEAARKYAISGLLLYQLAKLDHDIALSQDDKPVTFAESDIPELELNTESINQLDFGRSAQHPGVTHMFFDNNDDGKGSFEHFLGTVGLIGDINTVTNNGLTYSKKKIPCSIQANSVASKGKQISQQKESYYYIIKVTNPAGELLNTISFNDPVEQEAIKYFQGAPDFVVDRGHAGHEQDGISAINNNTKLAHIGSCGGFSKLGKSLEQNQDIQFIGTTGTGHKVVNDAIFWTVTEQACLGKTIVRNNRTPDKKFIKTIFEDDAKGFDNYKNYQLPPKQLGGAFRTKYNEILDDIFGMQPDGE